VRMVTDQATIYSIYFPSGSSGLERQAFKDSFNEFVLDWLQPELDSGRPVAVCGDVNVAHTAADIWNPKGNLKNSGFLPHEREWMDRLLARGWVDVWRALNGEAQAYSWWSNRGEARARDRGWRIDYLLVSPSLAARAVSANIVGTMPYLSDHCPISATFTRL
jgi:exodeoxyribonuclease III